MFVTDRLAVLDVPDALDERDEHRLTHRTGARSECRLVVPELDGLERLAHHAGKEELPAVVKGHVKGVCQIGAVSRRGGVFHRPLAVGGLTDHPLAAAGVEVGDRLADGRRRVVRVVCAKRGDDGEIVSFTALATGFGRNRRAGLPVAQIEDAERGVVDRRVVVGGVRVLGPDEFATDHCPRVLVEERVEGVLGGECRGERTDVATAGEREDVAVDAGQSDVVTVEFLLDGHGAVEELREAGIEDEHARDRWNAPDDGVAGDHSPTLDAVTCVGEVKVLAAAVGAALEVFGEVVVGHVEDGTQIAVHNGTRGERDKSIAWGPEHI